LSELAPLHEPNLLIVVSSPSGGGKTTVCDELMRRLPTLVRSVSMTTRDPRPGERDGNDYRFVSMQEFQKSLNEGKFAEWAEVHGNFYGTPRNFVDESLAAGRDVILTIDVQGGLNIKKAFPASALIFLRPPSLKDLEQRLRKRAADNEETIRRRLLNAEFELERLHDYDYVVENRDLKEAVDRVQAILSAEKSRVRQVFGARA